MREFHPHRRFIAYDPPQKDVFGNWKQAKGKEVLVQDETPKKEETEKKDETPKKEEPISVETPTKEESSRKEETPNKEETPTEKETPKKDETPVSQPPITEESWKTVKEKPRKSRNSGTVEMEGRKKSPTLPKLNYKKIIQKSLKPAEPIPAVITGPAPPAVPATSASPASPASSAAPSSTPQNETPKAISQLFSETPKTESKPSNETPSLTSFLSSLPPLQDTLPTDETPSQEYETPFHRFPAGISYNLDFDYGQAYGFGSFDASMAPYPYYYNNPDPLSYPFQSTFPPKTHYGEWREREMDLERDPWFLPAREDYRDLGQEYFGQNNNNNNNNNGLNYSNEELQVI